MLSVTVTSLRGAEVSRPVFRFKWACRNSGVQAHPVHEGRRPGYETPYCYNRCASEDAMTLEREGGTLDFRDFALAFDQAWLELRHQMTQIDGLLIQLERA